MSELIVPDMNTMNVTFHLNPENGTFSISRGAKFQRNINPHYALNWIRMLEGLVYMVSYAPHEFVDYALRVEDAHATREAFRNPPPPEPKDEDFDTTNVHFLPNGRLH